MIRKEGRISGSPNGPFVDGLERPVYPDIVQAARQDIQRTLHFLEDFTKKLHHSLQRVDELEAHPQQKACPFCGDRMFNIAPFTELATSYDLSRYDPSFLDQFCRYSWECQGCLVYVTGTPGYRDKAWVRTEFEGKRSDMLAARIFQRFSVAKEICCIRGSEWFVLVGREWYRFPGTAQEVAERLGV